MLLFVASLVVLFAAYLFCLHGDRTSERPPITTDDEQRQQIIRYLLNDNPKVAFVGTSLTHALKAEYFSTDIVSNLALPGGSPLTGLMILSNARHLPRVLVIETNILGGKADTKLVDYFRPIALPLEEPRMLLRDFKPIRTALCCLLHVDPGSDTMNKKPLPAGTRRAFYQKHAEMLLAQFPSNHDTTAAVSRALSNVPSGQFATTIHENALRIVEFADRMENEGVRVYFLEMPLMPSIANGWYSRAVREAIELANSPREDRWLKLKLDESQLRWTDAYHLDERSSILVVRAIEQALAGDFKPSVVPARRSRESAKKNMP